MDRLDSGFRHQRLDAYHVARELARECAQLMAQLPRGFGELRNQAVRSALATMRHIAEGTAPESHADKRSRFIVARGEVAELDATVESAVDLGLLPAPASKSARALCARVGAMLTGLIRREELAMRR